MQSTILSVYKIDALVAAVRMKRLVYPNNQRFPYIVIIVAYALYVGIFAAYHHRVGIGIATLAIFPVLGASWYFGIMGGLLTAVLSILANTALLISEGHYHGKLLGDPDSILGTIALFFMSIVAGRFVALIRERQDAFSRLGEYERERQLHTDFLELLNEITGRALEADSLNSTIAIILERVSQLFDANDCFLSFWDDEKSLPRPIAAYGSMSDIYPYIQFEQGERTPTVAVMEACRPIVIPDLDNSPHISSRISAILPSRSMLALPLIVQNRKLGAVLLGYNKRRSFSRQETNRAQVTSEQISLLLSKSLLLEEERKQVKQLTALHDLALVSIKMDNKDELISRATDIIGQNLFPDNVGILLLDEQGRNLRAHPSYLFFSNEEAHPIEVPPGKGITGQVAETGIPQRHGNVRRIPEYLDVDDRTVSEVCVPIKFKDRILGVINAESTKRDAFSEDDERLLITMAGQIATAMEQIRKAEAERKWLDQLAHSNDLVYILNQIATHIEKAFDTDEIVKNLGTELNKIDLTCIMAVHDKERDRFMINYTSMKTEFLAIAENGLGHPLVAYTFPCQKLKPQNILYPAVVPNPVDEIQMLFEGTRRQGVLEVLQDIGIGADTALLRLPLIFEENLLGMLWIWGRGLTKADLTIMSIFAKQIAISLERARLFQEVQSLAFTDPLTGLHNRRSILELGKVEFAQAQRMQRAFCCVMLDLDHFKQINDQYGHPIGDQVLREFGSRCMQSVREADLVGRYGGEELIIFLPETDGTAALEAAERLRRFVSKSPIKVLDREIIMTVSIGIASKDKSTTHLEALIARADQAMYMAKHNGRNCVVVS